MMNFILKINCVVFTCVSACFGNVYSMCMGIQLSKMIYLCC